MSARTLSAAVLALSLSARADEPKAEPKDAHAAGVDHRGDHGMGFSHAKTAHHFGLTKTGGFISADAKSADDAKSRDAIRGHFQHIAKAFKQGHFEMPMFIHGKTPPGVPAMKRLAKEIDYSVEQTQSGGKVVIKTDNAEALEAVHQFLQFQIEDHRTGDSTAVLE